MSLRRELVGPEWETLLQLRVQGRLSDEVRPHVEQDLDLEVTCSRSSIADRTTVTSVSP